MSILLDVLLDQIDFYTQKLFDESSDHVDVNSLGLYQGGVIALLEILEKGELEGEHLRKVIIKLKTFRNRDIDWSAAGFYLAEVLEKLKTKLEVGGES